MSIRIYVPQCDRQCKTKGRQLWPELGLSVIVYVWACVQEERLKKKEKKILVQIKKNNQKQ